MEKNIIWNKCRFLKMMKEIDRERSTSLINQTMQLMGMILINKNTQVISERKFFGQFSGCLQVAFLHMSCYNVRLPYKA